MFGESSRQNQITLRNDGERPLIWNAASIQPWIGLAPATDTLAAGAEATVVITIDRQNQAAGSIHGAVDITSNGGSAQVAIQADVAEGILTVQPLGLAFGLDANPLPVQVSNSGTGLLNWSAQVSGLWISLSRDSGTVTSGSPQTINVAVDRSQLPRGQNINGLLFIEGGAKRTQISVTVSVPDPVIFVNPRELDFKADLTSLELTITNRGSGNLVWSTDHALPWLSLDPGAGTTSGTASMVVSVNRQGLAAGPYSGTVRLTSNAAAQPQVDLLINMQVLEAPY